MTTHVTVFNHNEGHTIKVEVQSRGGDGKFAAAREVTLEPGQGDVFMVHSHQSIQVIELSHGEVAGAPV